MLGFDLRALQIGWPVRMPLSRSVGDGLWELRSKLPGGQIARSMFAFSDGQMVLLNAFVKKTQKTPPHEISLAKQRMKGVSE